VNARALRRGARKLRAARDQLIARDAGAGGVPSVQMLCASLAEMDAATLSLDHTPNTRARLPPDVLTLVEVVEHLDPRELHELGAALLGRCAPRALIVTTPNIEYNLNNMVHCSKERSASATCRARNRPAPADPSRLKKMIASDELCKGCALFISGQAPPFEQYPMRNKDHRFEWTRAEFRRWAEGLGEEYGYDARFDGVGGGPFDELADDGNPFHGPGPSAQVCVFERRERDTPATPTSADAADARPPLSSARCVWDSEVGAEPEVGHAALGG